MTFPIWRDFMKCLCYIASVLREADCHYKSLLETGSAMWPPPVSPARQLHWRCLWLQSPWCCATGESLVALKLLVRKDMLGLTECPVVLQCFNISQSFTLSVRSATELCWLTPAVSTELVHTESHWVFINLINWIRIMIIISFLIIYHF